MGGIQNTDDQRRTDSSFKPEPERRENYWQVVETLKNIVKNRFSKRRDIMQETHSDNCRKNNEKTDVSLDFFHVGMLSKGVLSLKPRIRDFTSILKHAMLCF